MYEKIKHYLESIFRKNLNKEYIDSESVVVMQLIVEAKTLAQLFVARARLIELNEVVKSIDSPIWANNKVKFLEARWNKQYRLWKIRG